MENLKIIRITELSAESKGDLKDAISELRKFMKEHNVVHATLTHEGFQYQFHEIWEETEDIKGGCCG